MSAATLEYGKMCIIATLHLNATPLPTDPIEIVVSLVEFKCRAAKMHILAYSKVACGLKAKSHFVASVSCMWQKGC